MSAAAALARPPASTVSPVRALTLVISADLRDKFTDQTINGHGGFQSLMRQLASQLTHGRKLTLTQTDLARIVHYARNYGEGGYQAALRLLLVEVVDQHLTSLVS